MCVEMHKKGAWIILVTLERRCAHRLYLRTEDRRRPSHFFNPPYYSPSTLHCRKPISFDFSSFIRK